MVRRDSSGMVRGFGSEDQRDGTVLQGPVVEVGEEGSSGEVKRIG